MSLLDFLISPAAAQAAPAAGQASPWTFPIMMVGMFVLMYFMVMRPQMKRAKEHRELLAKLERGDEVLTSGGVAGRIESLGEHFVSVEIAERIIIKVQRSAISAVLPKGTLKSS